MFPLWRMKNQKALIFGEEYYTLKETKEAKFRPKESGLRGTVISRTMRRHIILAAISPGELWGGRADRLTAERKDSRMRAPWSEGKGLKLAMEGIPARNQGKDSVRTEGTPILLATLLACSLITC